MMTLVGASAGRRVFVGFNDIAIEGEYVWVDGVMFTNTTANLWSPGEPSVDPINTQMADCGTALSSNGQLAEDNCDDTRGYVCQIREGGFL